MKYEKENSTEFIFVDPKNDVAFRKIFGDENKKEILISFLNNILEFAGTSKEIVDITIKNPYQVPKLIELKETILDIKAVDKRNIHYIIEMQVFHTTAFEKKVLYYVSKAYYQQLDRAENYPKLNFVELPKFNKNLEELEDIKDKWIYFVKNAGNLGVIPRELEEPKELREAFAAANQMSWSKEELDAYDAQGIYIQDERGRIEYALEEGKKIGIGEGRRGREAEIARELKKSGVKVDLIMTSTGLTKEEIENL